jgi:D-tyrosyl-tRNA(Tyr) deacylase
MRAVIQRVSQAAVEVAGKTVAEIDRGMVVLLGVQQDDSQEDARYLAKKVAGLRIFEDSEGKMNLSMAEVAGKVLVISQFTLYANTRKGRRPSFIEAALPEKADSLYQFFIQSLQSESIPVEKGIFGAMMMVKIFNEGPVTIIIDSEDRHKSRE